MMIDLATIDPATMQAGPEFDALIAVKWMGWHSWRGSPRWHDSMENLVASYSDWSPSTNPAHAGEARRKADTWTLDTTIGPGRPIGIECHFGLLEGDGSGGCLFSETNGDKGKAEALASTRAIAAAMQAAEAGKEEP